MNSRPGDEGYEYVIPGETPEDDQEISSGAGAEGMAAVPGGGLVLSGVFEYRIFFGEGGDVVTLGEDDAAGDLVWLAETR